jgi:hypothetical protein
MKWAATALALGLALAIPDQTAIADTDSHPKTADCSARSAEPAGREALDEDVTNVAIQAAFHPSDDQQRLLSLLLLISAQQQSGSTR